jgi:phasin family protein
MSTTTAKQSAEKLSQTTQEAVKATQEAVTKLADTSTKAAQKTTEQTSQAVSKIISFAAQQSSNNNSTLVDSFEQVSSFFRDNLKAFTKANADAISGVESLTKQVFALAQSQMESAISLQKSLASSKTLRDAMETQMEYAKSAYESGITELTKLSESVIKISNKSAEPIQNRINSVIEKSLKSAA